MFYESSSGPPSSDTELETRTTLAQPQTKGSRATQPLNRMMRASLFHHGEPILSVCVADDRVYTGGGRMGRVGTAKCFDAVSGKELVTYSGHDGPVFCVCVADRRVYTASHDSIARCFDAESGREIFTFGGPGYCARSVCVSDDRVYTCSGEFTDKTAKSFDAETGQERVTYRGHSDHVTSVCVADGFVYTGSRDGTAKCFKATTGQEHVTYRGHKSGVTSVCVSDGRLYTASEDAAKCFDAKTGGEIFTLTRHGDLALLVTSVCVADGRVYTGNQDGTARCYDAVIGEELFTLNEPGKSVSSVCVADGRVYTGCDDGTASCFDVTSDKNLVTFRGHTHHEESWPVCVADGRVYTASEDNTVKRFDGESSEDFANFRLRVTSVCVADGRVYTSSGNTAKCFNAATGEELVEFSGHDDTVLSVYVAEGRVYTGSEDNTAKCFDAVTSKELATFRGHSQQVNSVCAADGRVYTASDDGTAKCFNAITGKELATFKGHSSIVRSVCVADGRVYTASADGTAKCFDGATGRELFTFSGHGGWVNSVCVGASCVYTGSSDCTVKSFDAKSGKELVTHHFHGKVFSVYYTHGVLAVGGDFAAHLCPHADARFAPSWSLRLAADLDCDDPDPNKRYTEVLKALDANPGATYANQGFFNSLCENSNAAGLSKCLFDRNIPVAAVSYTELLEIALEKNSRECIRLVLNNLAKSIANHNAVYNHTAVPNHQFNQFESDLMPLILRVLEDFQGEAVEFFKNTELLRTPTVVDGNFDGSASLGNKGFTAFPSSSFIEVGFWGKKKDQLANSPDTAAVRTESVQMPFPGFFKPGHGGFLFSLLKVDDRELFGTITVHLVTMFKWDSFAKRKFYKDFLLYCVSLLAVVVSTLLLPIIPFEVKERYNDTYGLAMMVLLSYAALLKFYEVYNEIMVWKRGFPGGPASYFLNTWNLFRLVQMILCIGASYFTMLSTDGLLILLGISAFTQWLGLYYYLQAMPQMGPVVQMVNAITYDIRSILLVMLVAVLALANIGVVLVGQFTPELGESICEGYEDLCDHRDGFESFIDAIFTSYQILLLADLPLMIDSTKPTLMWRLVFLVTSLLTTLVLLNLLIARMNDAYERIQDKAEMEERLLKAKIVARYELTMSEDSHPDCFPPLVKALVQKGENRAMVKKSEWAGVLSEVKGNIVKTENKVMAKVKDFKKEVEENKKEVMAKITDLDSKLNEVLEILKKSKESDGETGK